MEIRLTTPFTGRLTLLDELKGLAILSVVLYHAGGVLAWNNVIHGELGVDMFVILSGVGLAFGSRTSSLREFFAKRLIRIFPVYWLVLTAVLVTNHFLLNRHYEIGDIVEHYLGIHCFFGDKYAGTINDSFWYISLLLVLYLIYGFGRRLLLKADWVLFIGAVVSLGVTLAYLKTGQSFCFVHLGTRLPNFFLGLLLGILLRCERLSVPMGPVFVVALFILTYMAYLNGVIFISPLVATSVMGLYAFGLKRVLPLPLIRPVSAAFKFLGDHSLEIFLIHQPMIREYNHYLQWRWFKIAHPTQNQVILGMCVAFVAVLLLAALLHGLQQRFIWPLVSRPPLAKGPSASLGGQPTK